MYRQLIRRALLFYPILFCVSIFLFFLKESATGDPVIALCGEGEDVVLDKRSYENCIKINKLDRAAFYFDISPSFIPRDELRKIFPIIKRESLEHILRSCGSWTLVQELEREMEILLELPVEKSSDEAIQLKLFRTNYDKISSVGELRFLLERVSKAFPSRDISNAMAVQDRIIEASPRLLSFRPSFRYYGLDNRFHYWWSDAIRFEFGNSYSGRSVNSLIRGSLNYTIGLNLISFVLAIGIGMGLVLLAFRFKKRLRWIQGLSSVVFAIPRFWLATILIFLFANKALFPGLAIFKLGGFAAKALPGGFFSSLVHLLQYLFLPVLSLSLGLGVLIFKHLQDKISEERTSIYVMAAVSRGLSERTIFFKYILPNAINPLLTIIGSMFMGLLGGSVIIETIFSLPGLGGLMFSAFMNDDWPVLFGFCFIGAIMTLLGYLLTDLLYLLFDPKLRLEGKSS